MEISTCVECRRSLDISQTNFLESFLMVQDPNNQENFTVHEDIERIETLQRLIAEEVNDFTLCPDCLEKLQKTAQEVLHETSNKRDIYQQKLVELELQITQQDQDEEQEIQDLENQLQELEKQEQLKLQELSELEQSIKELDRQQADIEKQSLIQEYKLQSFQQDKEEINARITVAERELEYLKQTNVIADVFYIDQVSQVFGRISGYRMGRTPLINVPFQEINAAWGQACLCLLVLASKCNYEWTKYELVPLGCYSRIIDKSNQREQWDLYGSDNNLNRIQTKMNTGMTMYLEALKEFGVYIEQQKGIILPYRIEQDRIKEVSIKFDVANLEKWTYACRCMLLYLKCIQAHCIKDI